LQRLHEFEYQKWEKEELEAKLNAGGTRETPTVVSQQTVASDLDRQIQSHQHASDNPARPHKPWWRFW
jgi:hypothetical protein